MHGNNLRFVVCFYEIDATDSDFALAWLYAMILHPSRFVGGGAINIFIANRNGGRNVPHCVIRLSVILHNEYLQLK